ncbi:unnamed protein product [Microthlaspi erraticum]|uniref:Uncharacterized protein n=1 Tax=Microthlaspi erraticum TaxID=1685480 RepID=A0A6D2ISJ7_9BRAS|nr:unnamed protein product [Microthlaspi erraticum]
MTYREQQKALGRLPVGKTSRAPPPAGDALMANAADVLAVARQSENENRASIAIETASQIDRDNAAVVSSRSHDGDSNDSVRRQNKRPRQERRNDGNGGSSHSSGSNGRPFYWEFKNSVDGPVLNDRGGVGYLQRHFKGAGVNLPPIEKMSEKEAYLDMAMANTKSMEANNRYVSLVEQRLRDSAPVEEVNKMRSTIEEMTSTLKRLQLRESEVEKKLSGVEELEHRNAVLADQLKDARAEGRAAIERSALLGQQNKDLLAEKDASLRLAAQATYRQLSTKYGKLLQSFKEMWFKKKDHTDAEISFQEANANLQLIGDLMSGESTLEVEAPLWAERVLQLEAEAKAKAVSDFSLRKFELPQLSEDSVLMEVNKVPVQVEQGIGGSKGNKVPDEIMEDVGEKGNEVETDGGVPVVREGQAEE